MLVGVTTFCARDAAVVFQREGGNGTRRRDVGPILLLRVAVAELGPGDSLG